MKVSKGKMRRFTVAERKAIRDNNSELPASIILDRIIKNRDLHLMGLSKKK